MNPASEDVKAELSEIATTDDAKAELGSDQDL
jgi:hypothetical protein